MLVVPKGSTVHHAQVFKTSINQKYINIKGFRVMGGHWKMTKKTNFGLFSPCSWSLKLIRSYVQMCKRCITALIRFPICSKVGMPYNTCIVYSLQLQPFEISASEHLHVITSTNTTMMAAGSYNKKSSHGRDSRPFTFYLRSYSSKQTNGRNSFLAGKRFKRDVPTMNIHRQPRKLVETI